MTPDRSYITCHACGLRSEGTPKEALARYRAHSCPAHEPDRASRWPAALVWALIAIVAVAVCGYRLGAGR